MLTDNKIKNLKPKDKPYPTADANGLTLYTLPTGSKSWRLRYRFHGRADTLTLGKYPLISLKEARNLKELYLSVLVKGIDPKVYKKQQQTAQQDKLTFKGAFDTWIDSHQAHEGGWGERTTKKLVSAFEKHVFPYVGNMYVEDMKTSDIYEVLRRIDDKGRPEVLKKVKRLSSRVFKDCVVKGIIEYNPVANITNDNFRKQVVKHYATVTSEDDIRELLLLLETYYQRGEYEVAAALNLAPYLMLRPGELVQLTWKNIEFKSKLIKINAHDMKMRREHIVPMSGHVQSILKEIKDLNLSKNYVFPSSKKSGSHIGAESLRAAIDRLGIPRGKFTTHGFRSMASTRLNEMGFNRDWIEAQLAHVDSNTVRGIYNNATYIEQRTKMMEQWANYLDNLKSK
jgi:integrase